MILRRYGSKMHSVRPDFYHGSITEISFVRDGALALDVEEFAERYVRRGGREFTARAKGGVQGEVKHQVLESLQEQLAELERALEDGTVLLIESRHGVDHPKARGKQTTIVVEAENRLVFEYTIDPPLRLGVFDPR